MIYEGASDGFLGILAQEILPTGDRILPRPTPSWTGGKMKEFGIANRSGAHCTGIEAVYRLRERLNLNRRTAVVGAVGSTFSLTDGIVPGRLAK